MVVGVFPIAKLGSLLLRQISKPLATFAKERAKNNHFFRTYICMPPAQFYNWCEIKAKMWVMNLGKPVTIPSLNEAMAIELGANLLGETIVFAIAAGVLYTEYARQARKEVAKEDARKEELETLTYTLQELYFQAERQDAQIRELMRTVTELESQVVIVPWKSRKETPVESPPPKSPPRFPPGSPLGSLPPATLAPTRPSQNISQVPEESEQPKGIITNALAYLQMNDMFGSSQRYHSIPIS